MFERVLGLPAHPLMVHAAVVLLPLLALGGVLYAVAPFTRRHFRWPLIFLAIAAPIAVYTAKLSGDAFSKHKNLAAPELQSQITDHKSFGDVLVWTAVALGLVVLVLAFAVPAGRTQVAERRSPDDTLVAPARRGPANLLIQGVLAVAVVGLAAVNLYYVFQAGDSGAGMVWTGF